MPDKVTPHIPDEVFAQERLLATYIRHRDDLPVRVAIISAALYLAAYHGYDDHKEPSAKNVKAAFISALEDHCERAFR